MDPRRHHDRTAGTACRPEWAGATTTSPSVVVITALVVNAAGLASTPAYDAFCEDAVEAKVDGAICFGV